MKTIILTAKSQKGEEVFNTQGKEQPDKKTRAALFVIGYKQEVISKEPYTIKVTLKRLPDVVCDEVIRALELKFLDLGAVREIDYCLEVS